MGNKRQQTARDRLREVVSEMEDAEAEALLKEITQNRGRGDFVK